MCCDMAKQSAKLFAAMGIDGGKRQVLSAPGGKVSTASSDLGNHAEKILLLVFINHSVVTVGSCDDIS